jgi:hypothetical protein
MIEVYGIIALALLAAGAMVGILTVVAVGIHREQSASRRAWPHNGFTADSPTLLASGVRAANGLHVSKRGHAQLAPKHSPDLVAPAGPSGPTW